MQKKEQSLCFTGHRSEKLPKTEEGMEKLKLKLWEEIEKAIENGVDTFYFGACYGFDLLCADIVAKRKRVIKMSDPKIIKLIAVIPFEEQASRWKESDRELYYDLLWRKMRVLFTLKRLNMTMTSPMYRLICLQPFQITAFALESLMHSLLKMRCFNGQEICLPIPSA